LDVHLGRAAGARHLSGGDKKERKRSKKVEGESGRMQPPDVFNFPAGKTNCGRVIFREAQGQALTSWQLRAI